MSEGAVKVIGGVRKHLQRTYFQRFNQWIHTRRLGRIGEDAFVDRNVRFLRHPQNVRLGANVIVKEGARVCPANETAVVEVGDWTTIGYHSFLFASNSITIGANCLIAPFCYLVDANHGVRSEALIRTQEMSAEPIIIEDDVWLGAGVTVLKGVRIGNGAVVSAGTVVREDVPRGAILSMPKAEVVGYRR